MQRKIGHKQHTIEKMSELNLLVEIINTWVTLNCNEFSFKR